MFGDLLAVKFLWHEMPGRVGAGRYSRLTPEVVALVGARSWAGTLRRNVLHRSSLGGYSASGGLCSAGPGGPTKWVTLPRASRRLYVQHVAAVRARPTSRACHLGSPWWTLDLLSLAH